VQTGLTGHTGARAAGFGPKETVGMAAISSIAGDGGEKQEIMSGYFNLSPLISEMERNLP